VTRDLRLVGVIDAEVVGILTPATSFDTLEEVVRWPLGMIADVVIQDEYTHDVIVRISSQTVHLVFDTT
jgi:prephenate dehydrogenase